MGADRKGRRNRADPVGWRGNWPTESFPVAIISLEKKFIFISNGKTGTTSIENQLGPYGDVDGLNTGLPGLWANKHIPPAVLRALLPGPVWESCFKFVFVRHPLDWFTSQFAYNLAPRCGSPPAVEPPGRARSVLRRLAGRRVDRPATPLPAQPPPPVARRRFTLEDVNLLHGQLHRYRGLPMAPTLFQTSYVCSPDGEVIVDFIGRFETLAADFESVSRRLGCQLTLPHLNATDHLPPGEAFEPEAEARVRQLWAVDFATLGYD